MPTEILRETTTERSGFVHRMRRIIVAAGAALTLLAATASPATAGTAPPEEWVKRLCTSLTTWTEDLVEAQEGNDLTTGSLEDRRDAVVTYLREVTDDTKALLRRLKKAGTPDVRDGKAIAKAFRKGIRQARAAFVDARKAAADLDTDSRRRFTTALGDIERDITDGADAVSDTFDDASARYDVEALDTAFNEEPACAGVS